MIRMPPRVLAIGSIAAFAVAPAFAQTIEERAAQVRQLLDSPPSVETVIDRGTRVIGQPPPGASPASPSGAADSRLTSDGVPLSPEFVERMNRLLSTGVVGVQVDHTNPRGAASVDNPRGAALQGAPQGAGPTWFKDYAPGILVIRRPDDGRVGGVSNLSTGSGLPTSGTP